MFECDATDRHLHKCLFVIAVDMFGIGVCRSGSAHIDGGNGFPIRLFAHALASNTVTHVPLKCLTSMFVLLRAKRGGPYPFVSFQNQAVLASKNHSSNPHSHRCL